MALIATSFKLLMLSVVIIVCGAVFNVPQLAFGQTEQAGKVTGSYKGTPKERFREAERLVKEGNLYGAFEEYQGAATAEPNNKKYLEKLTNISKVVSANALSNGIRQMAVAPDKAVDWLQRALRYSSANYT